MSIAGRDGGHRLAAPQRPDGAVHVVPLQVRAVQPARRDRDAQGRGEDRARTLRRARRSPAPPTSTPGGAWATRSPRTGCSSSSCSAAPPAAGWPRSWATRYLDDDLIARRDYYTDAELDRMLAAIPPTLRRRAEAYRDGINAWVAEARARPDASCRASSPRWRARRPPGRCATPPGSASSSPARCRRATAASSRTPARCGSWARAGFDKLLPLRTKGRVPTVPGAAGSSRPSRAARASRSAPPTRARRGSSPG